MKKVHGKNDAVSCSQHLHSTSQYNDIVMGRMTICDVGKLQMY